MRSFDPRSLLPALLLTLGLGCSAAPLPPPTPPTALPAAAAPAAKTASPDDAVLEAGRRWTRAFYDGRTPEMWEHFGEPLRRVFGDLAGLDDFRGKARAQLGAETGVVGERIEPAPGGAMYVRVARFERPPMPIRIAIELDTGGRIVAFGIRPDREATTEAPTDKLDYATRTALHLPFEGAWTVVWGGRTLAQNHHAATRDQRFAYDFLVVKDGSTHAGDGQRNGDYYAYGRPVLAPAGGRVVVAVDGVPENVPGQTDANHPGGNYVVIDHGDGEFSILAHLVPGSLAVHEGDRVEVGRTLGRCGNSGHSSEPHLHYHLQDSPRFLAGDGLPAPWVDFVADGRRVARAEVTRGQLVEAAPLAAHLLGEGS